MKETLIKLWKTRNKVNKYLTIAEHWKDEVLQEVYFDRLRTIDLKIEIEINIENHLKRKHHEHKKPTDKYLQSF